METVDEVAVLVGVGVDVNDGGLDRGINDGSGGDSILGPDVSAGEFIRSGRGDSGSWIDEGTLPEWVVGVGIKGVKAVVFSGDVEDLVVLSFNENIGEQKWLRVDLSIDGQYLQQSKIGLDIQRIEDDLSVIFYWFWQNRNEPL